MEFTVLANQGTEEGVLAAAMAMRCVAYLLTYCLLKNMAVGIAVF